MSLTKLSNEKLIEYYNIYKTGMNKTKRFEGQKIYNQDLKFAYHVVRLLNEVEQILTEGDLDLQRNREQLKSIRRGEWTQRSIVRYFETKEKELEKVYIQSSLPHRIREDEIRELLVLCLKKHFGDCKEIKKDLTDAVLSDIEKVLLKYRT